MQNGVRMLATIVGWLALSAAGALLLVLPDSGDRLVGFSDAHGLTPQDAAGVALLLAGWLLVWTRLPRRPLGPRAAALAGVGAGLVIASAAQDFEGWWVVGAAVLAAVQAAAFARGAR